MSVPVQIAISGLWLAAYLWMSLRYQQVWDARMREALGRRLNARVGWSKVDTSEAAFTDDSDPPVMAWHSETDGPLMRQLGHGLVVRAAYLAVIVLLGAVPPLALIG